MTDEVPTTAADETRWDELTDRAVDAAFRRLHPDVRSWASDDALREDLRAGVEFHANRHRRGLGVETNHRLAAREGTTPVDFEHTRVGFGDGREAWISLRFRGGWEGEAYVELDAWTFEPRSTDDVLRVVETARPRYRAVRATDLRVAHRPGVGWSPVGLPGVRGDQDVYAGRLDELLCLDVAVCADVSLAPVTDMAFLPDYLAAFDRLHATSAFHAREVNPQSEHALAAAVHAETFFSIVVGGETAGWIGVRELDDYPEVPLPGWEVLEELLLEPFRGRGLARTAQRRLIERLSERPEGVERVLAGVIHPDNHASVRTAERNGRICVGRRTLVPLRETRGPTEG